MSRCEKADKRGAGGSIGPLQRLIKAKKRKPGNACTCPSATSFDSLFGATVSTVKRVIRPLKKLLRWLRQEYFPSQQDRTFAKWWADGGDDKLRFDYELDERSLVIDLGGYRGQWASDLFSRYGCKIEVFEPVSEFADSIRKRFAKNGNIRVYQYGLGGASRTETISLSADGSSLFGESPERAEIRIVDVADWFAEERIASVTLLKINIEGGEYELLERLIETGLIKNIENIQVQFHEVQSNSAARMKLIQQRLAETHTPTYQYRFVWENWKRNPGTS